jgi:hypothetical protein
MPSSFVKGHFLIRLPVTSLGIRQYSEVLTNNWLSRIQHFEYFASRGANSSSCMFSDMSA